MTDIGAVIIGVLCALVIVMNLYGCAESAEQEDINEFCQKQGFEYGEEVIKETAIHCYRFKQKNISDEWKEHENSEIFSYEEYHPRKKERLEVGEEE